MRVVAAGPFGFSPLWIWGSVSIPPWLLGEERVRCVTLQPEAKLATFSKTDRASLAQTVSQRIAFFLIEPLS